MFLYLLLNLPFRISSRITFFGFLLLSFCSFPFLTFPCEKPFVLRDTFIRAESGKDEIRLFLSNGETVEADWLEVARELFRIWTWLKSSLDYETQRGRRYPPLYPVCLAF
jgi:hypothetical protein